MNDCEYTFMQDVREKKNIAHSARHKKNGSKSKYVSLPHDHLTKKEKEALNGPTKTICLGKAMSWNEFKGIRKDLQEEYLTTLRDRYSVTLKDIAEMLGTTHGRLSSYKSERKLNVSFPRGRKIMSLEQKEAWQAFCGSTIEETPVEEPITVEPDNTLLLVPTSFSVEFNGYVTMADISAMIQKMTGTDYLMGKVRICYEKE